MGDRRGAALIVVAAIGLGDLVGPQPQHGVGGVGHRRDIGGVDRLQCLDEFEDAVELDQGALGLVGAELEAGEIGDPGDVGRGDRRWAGGCDGRTGRRGSRRRSGRNMSQWKTPIFVVNLRNYRV